MRVLMISKACIAGAYQKKLEEIASRGVDLTVIVPPYWRDDADAGCLWNEGTPMDIALLRLLWHSMATSISTSIPDWRR